MIRVKIAYDPYHMKTSLNINGQNVKRVARGYERISSFVKQDIPLQSWIDPIPFQNWKGLLWEVLDNSLDSEVEFYFRGRKIDFLDLQEAMLAQSETGKYKVDVTFPEDKQVFCYDDQVILNRAKKAYELIQSDRFKQILDDKLFEVGKDSELYNAYQKLPQKFNEAMDGEFRIVFSGMYSCGKSTIINAILGKELLPTRDGTCTAKVFKISHDPYVAFAKMSCVDKDGKTVVDEQEYTEETLKKQFTEMFPRGKGNTLLPSNPPEIDTVLISTSMSSLYPQNASYQQDNMKLVIMDTPGTSSGKGNSAEAGTSHFDITKNVIENGKKEIVVFATNATLTEDTSIIDFLKMVDSCDTNKSYDQRYLFVLNKADDCGTIVEESWPDKLQDVKDFYSKHVQGAIHNPRLFPTSALAAFSIRADREVAYKHIRPMYYDRDDDTGEWQPSESKENYHFDEFCSTSQAIKDDISDEIARIKDSELKEVEKIKQEILLHSGIVSLEMAIRDYIEKYAFPLKIQDLLQSYETIFTETDQLINVANSNFEKAIIAFTDADANRKREVENKEAEEKTKESLVRVCNAILDKKERLDNITSTFRHDVEQQTEDIKYDMDQAISNALYKAKRYAKTPTIKEDVRKIIDTATLECQQKINNHFAASKEQTKSLENEIKTFFHEVREMIDFGETFSIDNTTDFESISTDSISKIQNVTHQIRNPELDEGSFFVRLFKRINPFFDNEKTVDDGINLDELGNKLEDIRAKFDKNIDGMFQRTLDNLEQASLQLKENLDRLERKIAEHADRLNNMRLRIDQIAADVQGKADLKNRLDEYNRTLTSVREFTYFDEISEE